jgi:hypothetical protein
MVCLWLLIAVVSVILVYYSVTLYQEKLENKQRELEANLVLTGNQITDCISEVCPKAGCKTQEAWQTAYYKLFGKKTSCAVALYKTKPEYLVNKVPYPRHKTCYSRANTEFFEQEGINYNDLKKRYLTSTHLPKTVEANSFKVPPKLNFVWLTSEEEFKTKPAHFFKINTYIFHNTSTTSSWAHTLWTNNLNWIPAAAKEQLKANKIRLRSIDELALDNLKHQALRTLSKTYATQHKWGMASDIARDLVIYYEGGVYVDGDYKILNTTALENYMKSYRSFFGINDLNAATYDFFEVINAFMASEPRGKIIEEKLNLVHRNTMAIAKAPDYVKYPCYENEEVLFKTGPIALTIAFALKQESSDVLLPYCSLFQLPYALTCLTKPKLGKHDFHSGWTKSLTRKKLIY